RDKVRICRLVASLARWCSKHGWGDLLLEDVLGGPTLSKLIRSHFSDPNPPARIHPTRGPALSAAATPFQPPVPTVTPVPAPPSEVTARPIRPALPLLNRPPLLSG